MEEGELSSASSASDEEGKMEDIEAEKEEGEKTESWEAGPGDAVLEESLLGALQEHLEKDISGPLEIQTRGKRKREGEVEEGERKAVKEAKREREVEIEEDRVPLGKLQQLASSVTLHEMLANPHLQQLLLELNITDRPQQALHRAMGIPVFVEFADKCLRVCGLREEELEDGCKSV